MSLREPDSLLGCQSKWKIHQEGSMCAQRGDRHMEGMLHGDISEEIEEGWACTGDVRLTERECPRGEVSLRGVLCVESTAWVRRLRGETGPKLSCLQLVVKAEGLPVGAKCVSSIGALSRIWGKPAHVARGGWIDPLGSNLSLPLHPQT